MVRKIYTVASPTPEGLRVFPLTEGAENSERKIKIQMAEL
jgi:hypothetical protein